MSEFKRFFFGAALWSLFFITVPIRGLNPIAGVFLMLFTLALCVFLVTYVMDRWEGRR